MWSAHRAQEKKNTTECVGGVGLGQSMVRDNAPSDSWKWSNLDAFFVVIFFFFQTVIVFNPWPYPYILSGGGSPFILGSC